MKIGIILELIDMGSMALPEFQRGYVWNREQVRGLMHSLYRKHPVGSLLVWVTKTELADARGDQTLQPGSVKLLLDGQQRITSLYGIIKGRPPKFFDGDRRAFTGLYFNFDEETFEFHAPMKMKGNPYWVDITKLMQTGPGEILKKLMNTEGIDQENLSEYINRLQGITGIKEIELHIEEVAGEEKTVDVVVDIFNRVNSGGTKLSKGDLALAKICASWPDARDEMKKRLAKWQNNGFHFKLEWLLRVINSILTGESLFSALKDVTVQEFSEGLKKSEEMVDKLLTMISGRLGLDHDRVLGSRYSFPLLARYLVQKNGRLDDHRQRDKLLYWYVHTFLWGRYAGSTESVLAQDLNTITAEDGSLDKLIAGLRQIRGDLKVYPEDFNGWSRGARFYPMLYMLSRVWKTRDFDSGIELSDHMLGRLSSLQVHHIFPKKQLKEYGYSKSQINAIANFTFLTQETNLLVSAKKPEKYLPIYEKKHPGILASHWISDDPRLWKIENYLDFLKDRRERLAKTANQFLDGLAGGQIAEKVVSPPLEQRDVVLVPGSIESDDEMKLLIQCNNWVVEQGLSEGELSYELTDDGNQTLAIVDLAWPEGFQEGLSEPIALLLNEGPEIEAAVNQAGYRFFTDFDELKDYILSEVLADKEKTDESLAKERDVRRVSMQSPIITGNIIESSGGLLDSNQWQPYLKDYPTQLLCGIRKLLLNKVPDLVEKFNSKYPFYFGYRTHESTDKAYIYVQMKKMIIDLNVSKHLLREFENAGFTIRPRENFQAQAGWLTGWCVPQDHKNPEQIVNLMLKAFK